MNTSTNVQLKRSSMIVIVFLMMCWLGYLVVFDIAESSNRNEEESKSKPKTRQTELLPTTTQHTSGESLVFVRHHSVEMSVVIPFMTGGTIPQLLHSIQSVVAQQFTQWEILIPTDSFSPELRSALDKITNSIGSEKLRILPKRKHIGIGACINAGIGVSHGSWIQILLAGDVLATDLLQSYSAAIAHPHKNVTMLRSRASRLNLIQPNVEMMPNAITSPSDTDSPVDDTVKSSHPVTPFGPHAPYFDAIALRKVNTLGRYPLFAKSLWMSTTGISPVLWTHWDWDFWLRCERNVGLRPAVVNAKIFSARLSNAGVEKSSLDKQLERAMFVTAQPNVWQLPEVIRAHRTIMRASNLPVFQIALKQWVDMFGEEQGIVWLWWGLTGCHTSVSSTSTTTTRPHSIKCDPQTPGPRLASFQRAEWLRPEGDWQSTFWLAITNWQLNHRELANKMFQHLNLKFGGIGGLERQFLSS
eukprot:TRINITY_DN1832_c0_g1_i1.p1 TRINITY_DN1832_c0_g1~~TRINITY_DN1832_c0_g1_i1.p1  ORF type:complete len:498 (-),score=79.71 TRINITY_DN1832_c0_g1_i1:709-2124(-)